MILAGLTVTLTASERVARSRKGLPDGPREELARLCGPCSDRPIVRVYGGGKSAPAQFPAPTRHVGEQLTFRGGLDLFLCLSGRPA